MDKNSLNEGCGVSEESFPFLEKCLSRSDAGLMATYQKLCPYCRVSTSLPDGASLRTVSIFECQRLGYGKRLSD